MVVSCEGFLSSLFHFRFSSLWVFSRGAGAAGGDEVASMIALAPRT